MIIIFHQLLVYSILCSGLEEDRRDVDDCCSRPAQAPHIARYNYYIP